MRADDLPHRKIGDRRVYVRYQMQTARSQPRASHRDVSQIVGDELTDFRVPLDTEITILHIIYQQKAYEGHAKDYEFSGTSMREHWQSGYEDTRRTLKRQEWMTMPAPGSGVVVHDVHRHED